MSELKEFIYMEAYRSSATCYKTFLYVTKYLMVYPCIVYISFWKLISSWKDKKIYIYKDNQRSTFLKTVMEMDFIGVLKNNGTINFF